MKLKISATMALLSFLSLKTFAQNKIITCEGDGAGGHVKLEYRFVRAGQYEALQFTYGSENVLDSPKSKFNHMGAILFQGLHGIEFITSEHSADFYVTVPGFGGQSLKATEGKCTLMEQSKKVDSILSDTVIEQRVHNVSVSVNDSVIESPYKPFDGDVSILIGNNFDSLHRLPIRDNKLISFFAPGNTADILLYKAKLNGGSLPGILAVTLVERTQFMVVHEDPNTCFHCMRQICAKGIAEKVTLEFSVGNSSQKSVIFEKGSQGFDSQYQEVPMETCAP